MRSSLAVAFIAVSSVIALGCGQEPLKPVYFSFIVSFGEHGYRSSGAVPAIDIALDAVQDLQILPGYNLTYEAVRNSKCTRTDSINAFFEDTQITAAPKIAVIGCGCSTATEPVAEISHHWNITQISFATGVALLSDRSRFRYYYRTTPTFTNTALAILGIMNKFQWRRIGFITQNQNLFLTVLNDLEELQRGVNDGTSEYCCFDSTSIIMETSIFDDLGDPVVAARETFDKGKFHVFLINSYSKFARHIICEASKRNLVYPHYAWIMFAWYPERWWTEEVSKEHIACSDEELEEFLKRARPVLINTVPEPDDYNIVTSAGFSSQEFIDEYNTRTWPASPYNLSTIYLMAFDAMWTVVQMLNVTETMRLKGLPRDHSEYENCRHMDGDLVPLDEFNYTNAFMGCVMSNNYYKTNFTGVSGPVRYDANGTIVYTRLRISQWREENGELKAVRFGYLDRDSNFSLVYDRGESDSTVYPDAYPPDGTPVPITHTYHTSLVVIYYFLALCGLVTSLLCLLFNFIYRNKKVIRLTTPQLNYLIVCGAMLMYISVFFGVLPTTDMDIFQVQCIAHVWAYGVGYLLVYGTILSKMWRVYQIFHNPNPNKTILKTWHLMCVVGIIAGFGALLITAKTIAQFLTTPELVTDYENPEGYTSSSVLEENSVWQCYESGSISFIFDLIIFIYLGLLQLVGIILSFQTRKVKIPILNDSKSVATLIYISSIVLVVIVLITFILRGYINVTATIFSGGILLLASIFIALIFIPKVLNLYHDPAGDKIFSDMHPTRQTERWQMKDHHNSMAASMAELKDAEKVVLLNSHLTNLKQSLKEKETRIAELETIIRSST